MELVFPMPSNVPTDVPRSSNPTTASMRNAFSIANTEVTAIQTDLAELQHYIDTNQRPAGPPGAGTGLAGEWISAEGTVPGLNEDLLWVDFTLTQAGPVEAWGTMTYTSSIATLPPGDGYPMDTYVQLDSGDRWCNLNTIVGTFTTVVTSHYAWPTVTSGLHRVTLGYHGFQWGIPANQYRLMVRY